LARRKRHYSEPGSDAHDPLGIGREFGSAAAMALAAGFDPDGHASELWVRC
jgi:hypothetical protein